jgi:acetylornithine deacetylase/succinyl-diaminopimelate desuccinylase-like protein
VRAVFALLCTVSASLAQTPAQGLAREVFQQLVEIDTTEPAGSVTRASEAMAARFRAAGYAEADVQVLGEGDRHRNLVVRLRGSGAGRPILFNSHLDVVEARREDWSFDPFTFREQDGFFYGRGTQDDKSGAAALVAAFIRMKREGFRPSRDLILALTAGEETGAGNGVAWLLRNRRSLIDAEYCINVDSGGGEARNAKPYALDVETSEKTYHTLFLEVKNKGGHSSLPEKDNAIYRLARALDRIAQHEFPARLNETVRAYFAGMAQIPQNPAAADMRAAATGDAAAIRRLSESPFYNALVRTTCVATEIAGGHAENALPQTAKASVNCRVLPDESPAEVERTIRQVVADPAVTVRAARQAPINPPSPLRPDVMAAIERAAHAIWPGVPVIPIMETGGTDGRLLRAAGIPTYGETGMFIDDGDVRAHGRDERLRVASFYEGCDFLYRLIEELAVGR